MTYFLSDQRSDAVAATSCSVLITDASCLDNPITYANEAFTTLCGYARADILGMNCRFLQGPDTDVLVSAEIRAAVNAGRGIRREILNYRKDGTTFWNDLTIDPIRDRAGTLTGFVGVQVQVDAAHLIGKEKADAESRLAGIADHIPGYIYQRLMRADGTIELTYCSRSLSGLLGVDEKEATARFYDHVHPDDREALLESVRHSAANMSMFREEFRLVSANGTTHWLRSDSPPRRLQNGDIVWDGLAIEISAEKRWESEIASQALRDPLTGIMTRGAWRQALTMHFAADSLEASRCGILHIDIAAFRDINDNFGQPVGDEILKETAQRVAKIAEPVAGIAARLGGDELAVFIPDCRDKAALSSLAHSTTKLLAEPIHVGQQFVTIRTCIGATMCEHQESSELPREDIASELMTQAELALRWAKQVGGNAHLIYSHEQDDRFRDQAVLGGSLEQAIANGELVLHYQPLVDLESGRIVCAEALVRWEHPALGMQRPDLFIPLAEKLGLIVKLGGWVLRHALTQRTLWHEAGLAPPPISINVSGSQLLDPGFIELVEETLNLTGADARDFELELTEGLLIEPSVQIMTSLRALRHMGFAIAIDDFGSGHASFRYLRDFPVDKLKIDQVFVRKLVLESTDALIIRAIISLARSMGVHVVAEGIETEMQRDFLRREGCDVGQGYFFSMPLVGEDFAWMLASDIRLPMRDHRPTQDGIDKVDSSDKEKLDI